MATKSFLNGLKLGAAFTLALCLSTHVSAFQTQPRLSLNLSNSGAIQSDGTILTWGAGADAGVSDPGNVSPRSTSPVLVPGLDEMIEIAAGKGYYLALRRDGTVFAWGYNLVGQLGDGTTSGSYIPVQVSGLGPGSGVIALAASTSNPEEASSYALKADGTVWAWGSNLNGRLGNGSVANRSRPVRVSGINNARAISAGDGFVTVLLADGTVVAWGKNDRGQLGRGGSDTSDGLVPEPVVGLTGVKSIASGFRHTLAYINTSTVKTWGDNSWGAFCTATSPGPSSTPVSIAGLSDVVQVAAGIGNSLFLQSNGQVQGCGDDSDGGLGDGPADNSNRTALTNVYNNGEKATRIWAGGESVAIFTAINSSKQVVMTGYNIFGELGVGDTDTRYSFTPVKGIGGTGTLRLLKPVSNFVSVGPGQQLDPLDFISGGRVSDVHALNLVAGRPLRLASRFDGAIVPNFLDVGNSVTRNGYIEILNGDGVSVYTNDDCVGVSACVDYVPTYSGVHYLTFSAAGPNRFGSYTLHTPTYNGPHTNHDSYADILWRNANTNQFVVWNMAGNYNGASGASLPAVGAGWVAKAQGDLDGDGVSDLIFQDGAGNVSAWLLDGLTTKGGGNIGWMNGFNVVGAGDLNGDGRSDIILRNGNQIAVWFMNGMKIDGNFAIASAGVEWRLVGARDMNGNTTDDLIFHNANTGQVALWLMSGKTITSASIIATTPTTWSVAGLGDFNDDKRADILWRNNDGTTAVWLINPSAANPIISAAVVATVGNEWLIKATGDYNGDGKADVMWHRNDGLIHFWFMNGVSQLSTGNSNWSAGFEWQPIQ